ncbi:CPCC family cysteine-rich protein [Pleionea sediminis]|uniref:CPCC family cysteine-rich protein n=1 Tax=Pleionea sediminis TaxID=2569479 RepID=UPI0013DDBADC|nr:CPCC family cysteine-rich protein [Pleionea sediminis]
MKLEEFPQSESFEQCPCCDYFSLAERGKSLICPVCYWEDDCCNPSSPDWTAQSDVNNDMTLIHARINFKKFGACDAKWRSTVICTEERNSLKCRERNV